MTFLDMQNAVKQGVLRNDLSYDQFINSALREIQQRRSWSFMRTRQTITLPAGQTSVALPSNFKELQNVRPCIMLAIPDPSIPGAPVLKPVDVTYEQDETRRVWNWSASAPSIRVFIQDEEDPVTFAPIKTINIAIAVLEDMPFVVRYYRFLPDLVNDTDTSPFIDNYPEMVELKAKVKAFNRINDPAAGTAEQIFGEQFGLASRQDAYKDVSGKENRM